MVKELLELLDFDSPEDYLEHYGVLGMRWGVRNDEATAHFNATDPATGQKRQVAYNPSKVKISRSADGRVVVTGDKKAVASVKRQLNTPTPHPDHKIARETLKKSLATVSNKDLQATNQRLNLEKQYSQLRYERSTVGKGKAQVTTVLGLLGTGAAVATAYTKLADPKNQAIIKQGVSFITKSISVIPRAFKNPEAVRRAANVARLAARV